MTPPVRRSLIPAICLFALLILAGCSTTSTDPVTIPPAGSFPGAAFTGKVLAGTTPIIGATVQLYAAGTTGNGSAPTPLLTTALTTDTNGAFSVTTPYTCPSSTSILYIIATASHAGTELMTSPGACNSITSASTYTLNELTTVASAYAFSQFLAPGAQLGATSTNSSGITLAAGTLANLVNPTTGVAPGAALPSTGKAPTAELDTLANLLNACIVSTCTQLYTAATATTPPTNTLDAILNIAHNPGTNVATLYTLSAASTAFTPTLTTAPRDWTLFLNFAGGGMNNPSGVAVDSTGRVWVANYVSTASLFSNTGVPAFSTGITGKGLCNSYAAAIDANDVVWIPNEQGSCGGNTVTVLNSSGASVGLYTAGGLNFPIAVAIDTTNDAWVVDNGDSSLTLLTNTGTPLSGANGYNGLSGATQNFTFPVAVAVDSKRNGYLANFGSNTVTKAAPDGSSFISFVVGQGPAGVAIDASDNVWTANFYANTLGLISSSGKVLSGTTGFSGGGLDHPQGIAVDGAGNVWAVNYRSPTNIGDSLTELSGAASTTPGTALSPAIGWGTNADMLEAFGIAIDAAGNIWVTSFSTNTLTEFVGLAAPVKTPLLGATRVP